MEQNLSQYPGYHPPQKNSWKLVKTGKHQELNLQNDKGEYLLSPIHIAQELREWASSKDISKKAAIVVYGSALGYPIEAFKDWLQADKSRKLIIVEESNEIFEHFLHQNIDVKDLQIEVYFLQKALDEKVFDKVAKVFPRHMIEVMALPYYHKNREFFDRFKFTLEYLRHSYQSFFIEYLDHGLSHFKNFYRNILRLNESFLIEKFYNAFPGIPAIVIGAGPSLQKNIEILKKLKDKALIIAGGTSLNALNVHGMEPHLALGVDPFESFEYRTLASTSFLTPFIYKTRMHAQALDNVCGPLIYFPSGASYTIEKWFDEKLGFQEKKLELGTNVVNISLSLASAFGCNPLIAVGVDLAYTEDKRYSKGLKKHGTTYERLNTKSEGEEIIVRKDIYGKPVNTLMKWIQESFWYSEFQKNHPHQQIINSTEGGIGFPYISNIPLKMVDELLLKKSYDLDGFQHAAMLAGGISSSSKKLMEVFKTFLESLGHLLVKLSKMEKENPQIKNEDTRSYSDFKGEIAYDFFLKEFEEIYDEFYSHYTFKDNTPTELLKTNPGKFVFLKNTVRIHLQLIQSALDNYFSQETHPDFAEPLENVRTISHEIKGDKSIYRVGDTIVSESEWIDGKRGSSALFYYLDGQIAYEKKYQNTLLHGPQTRYHPNGKLAALLHYHEGYLDGEAKLYFPNGQLKRELKFAQGSRLDFDRIYDEEGHLVNESFYKDDLPVGFQRVFKKGLLMMELEFDEKGKFIKGLRRNEKGEIQPIDRGKSYDYFMHVADGTSDMTISMNKVFEGFKETLKQADDPEMIKELNILSDLDALKGDIDKLQTLSNELNTQAGIDPTETDEPLWKNRETEDQLKKEIQAIQLHFGKVFHQLDKQINLYKQKKKKS